MIGRVQVKNLPSGISFPAELQHKIRYDDQGRQLVFDGFMSKATFDRLYRLNEDRDYRRALEELFQVCAIVDTDDNYRHPLQGVLFAGLSVAAIAGIVALTLMFVL